MNHLNESNIHKSYFSLMIMLILLDFFRNDFLFVIEILITLVFENHRELFFFKNTLNTKDKQW